MKQLCKSTLKCVRQPVQGVVRGGEGRARGWVGCREGHNIAMYVCTYVSRCIIYSIYSTCHTTVHNLLGTHQSSTSLTFIAMQYFLASETTFAQQV